MLYLILANVGIINRHWVIQNPNTVYYHSEYKIKPSQSVLIR